MLPRKYAKHWRRQSLKGTNCTHYSTVKVTYSTMPNIQKKVSSHNRKIITEAEKEEQQNQQQQNQQQQNQQQQNQQQ